KTSGPEPLRHELELFLEACARRTAPAVDVEAGGLALRVVEAAHLSSKLGRRVLLSEGESYTMGGEIVPSIYAEPFRLTTFIGEIWQAEAAARYFHTEEEAQIAEGIAYYVQQRWNQWEDVVGILREPTNWENAVEVLGLAVASVLLLLLL